MTDASFPPVVQSNAWKVASWIVLALLTGAMVLLVPRHEPWFDEAQAWLLARDASWGEIIWQYARFEGSPSLWHTLLMFPAKAGLPPMTLNIISASLALIGAALLLFKSPLPPWLRLLLPCGFFFFYQYGLVARSYALLMPLLWLTALTWPRRFERPWPFVGMLIVTSQVSLHAAWIAGILMAVFTFEAWWYQRVPMKQWVDLVIAFAANTCFIAAQLWPAKEAISQPQESAVTLARVCTEMSLDAISPWPWLSAMILIGLLLFFYTRGVLLSYLLASAGLVALFALRFFSVWHQGLLFAIIVLHLWLAWVSPVRRRIGSAPANLWPNLAAGLLTGSAAFHVWWAVMASWNDWKYPYSGSREAAAYLKANGIDRERIHIFKFTTYAILLYLDHNPFANVAPYTPGSFWAWTREAFAGQTPAAIVKGEPPWIMVGSQRRSGVDPTAPPLPGYTMVRLFPGRIIWKDGFYLTDSYYLYRRD